MKEPDLQKLTDLATKVSGLSDELGAAISTEREARASVLAAVIEAVRPALRALSSKIGDGDLRGVVLDEDDEGVSLILTEEGTLVQRIGAIESLTPISPRHALDMDITDLSTCVEALTEKLTQYANGAAGHTALKARARAERLRALCLLLG
jgi:hypothetical protein